MLPSLVIKKRPNVYKNRKTTDLCNHVSLNIFRIDFKIHGMIYDIPVFKV